MKINDKHLAWFATSNSPVDKESYMMKRGEMNKAFQKRWFVLKGNLLFYFEKKGDREPIGIIILEGCTIELAESADAFTFEIGFQGAGSRTYVLATETQDEMESWMKAITCAGYDYMKLMVSELQRQLDELNAEQNNYATGWSLSGEQKHGQGGMSENLLIASRSAGASSSGRTQGAQSQLLVDLSVPSTNTSSQSHQARHNPFNQDDQEGLDLFGATPFQGATNHGGGAGQTKPRSFDAMHEEYGRYIQLKMRESVAKMN